MFRLSARGGVTGTTSDVIVGTVANRDILDKAPDARALARGTPPAAGDAVAPDKSATPNAATPAASDAKVCDGSIAPAASSANTHAKGSLPRNPKRPSRSAARSLPIARALRPRNKPRHRWRGAASAPTMSRILRRMTVMTVRIAPSSAPLSAASGPRARSRINYTDSNAR